MKLVEDRQDLLTFILIIIWVITDVFAWIKFGIEAVTISNIIWILLFGILTLIKYNCKKFRDWMYIPLKNKEGK